MKAEIREKLAAPFDPSELRTFQGRGGQTFTYVEDERVMDRLDAAGLIWSLLVVPVGERVAKVTLVVTDPYDGSNQTFEDFGYPNNEQGEELKQAVSDGIRRVGRMAGIGRYLYTKQEAVAPVARPQVVAQRPPAPTTINDAQRKLLMAAFNDAGITDSDDRKVYTLSKTGKQSSKDLTNADLDVLLVALQKEGPEIRAALGLDS